MNKIKLEVKNDYDSNYSWELYKDNLEDLLDGLDVRVENSNTRNTNILEKVNSYRKGVEYKNYIDVSCKGYSQGDWDDYKIYFDYSNDEFIEEFSRVEDVAKELEKLYTHKNDYWVQQIEVLDSGHEKTLECLSFSILDIEFPENSDIKYRIDEEMIKYDEIEFNQN
tara:strand:+ start:684 stop:1184 length:501 start_codon:yes stop_codon:yes gene_type:complete